MAEARITPEKELLNLIEGSKDNKTRIERELLKRKARGLLSLGAIKARFTFFKEWLKSGFKDKRFHLDIKTANRILGFFIFILAVYFILSILVSTMNFKKTLDSFEAAGAAMQGKSLDIPEAAVVNPVSHYLEKARVRDIFSMADEVAKKESEKDEKRAIISGLAQNLKLVGISWSDDPVAIIEDTKLKQAFFLKKGQRINDLIVKAIYYKDKVILGYAGEEIELR